LAPPTAAGTLHGNRYVGGCQQGAQRLRLHLFEITIVVWSRKLVQRRRSRDGTGALDGAMTAKADIRNSVDCTVIEQMLNQA